MRSNVSLCRAGDCQRSAIFHVIFATGDNDPDPTYSNLCRLHCAQAMRDGARAAHQLTADCFDGMYYPELVTWIYRDNRCGLLTTYVDPFEGWRLQDA